MNYKLLDNWCDNKSSGIYAFTQDQILIKKERFLQSLQRDEREKYALKTGKRRAEKNGLGGKHTIEEWGKLKEEHKYTCLLCGRKEGEIKLTKDHIIPLTRWKEWIGRNPETQHKWNSIKNIQPLCGSCNSIKKDKILTTLRV